MKYSVYKIDVTNQIRTKTLLDTNFKSWKEAEHYRDSYLEYCKLTKYEKVIIEPKYPSYTYN